ncbi:hypothetical protein HMPREF0201_00536 [Cedecea davisae DSM 4568]|uniref:Uncharacterized protein n=1 Tax=Cedecea davisae DSM 4568 TaxID=566551 RepID=S3J812_9ENTR|nr:hypothetical protein HMPREF0201_00536 [Cedecea davisae DSM 4568]
MQTRKQHPAKAVAGVIILRLDVNVVNHSQGMVMGHLESKGLQ